jgi:hypothetical protein
MITGVIANSYMILCDTLSQDDDFSVQSGLEKATLPTNRKHFLLASFVRGQPGPMAPQPPGGSKSPRSL